MAIQGIDGITWCDETINPWWGCTRVEGSPACEDPTDKSKIVCYAERDANRYGFNDSPKGADKAKKYFPIWGAHEKRRFFGDKPFERIAAMNKAWAGKDRRGRAFIMSFGDWAEGRPDQQPYLQKLWHLWPSLSNVDGLFLTKRPQLIKKLCPFSRSGFDDFSDSLFESDTFSRGDILLAAKRAWHGTTVENKYWLDIRWPLLRDAAFQDCVAWLSIEPQVEGFDLPQDFLDRGQRAWVVVGGQSASNAIPFDPAWARRFRDQCKEAGVPFHMKQMSGNSKRELQAIPPDLMIREFPVP